jgi:hypothetical protein
MSDVAPPGAQVARQRSQQISRAASAHVATVRVVFRERSRRLKRVGDRTSGRTQHAEGRIAIVAEIAFLASAFATLPPDAAASAPLPISRRPYSHQHAGDVTPLRAVKPQPAAARLHRLRQRIENAEIRISIADDGGSSSVSGRVDHPREDRRRHNEHAARDRTDDSR